MEQLETIMRVVHPDNNELTVINERNSKSTFITANTVPASLEEIKKSHIIPVFTKDNEPLISHAEFVEATIEIVRDNFPELLNVSADIRLSHPIKGRIPEAKNKSAQDLMEWEKTLYYERMAFMIEIPSVTENIDGNLLSLTVGGVKAYNRDNLYSKNISDQHFKIFIGFQNKVCTNLCIWTDGFYDDLKVKSIGQLKGCIKTLLNKYEINYHLNNLKALTACYISEHQFAQIIGRCRMYGHLPAELKSQIPPLLFGDQQISIVVKDFYRDESFCKDDQGNINLWRLYNLFTNANKTSYIDSFLARSVNAFNLVEQIRFGVQGAECWYLS